ncbi:hypothetical protein [Emticicia aquatilis]|uniref:hypothetical protein n=1 Tax=Emticicia aquatilis TaxID=1537369 RepID=UPI001668FFB3|nr:hypothetical protein [Emticicia aquatilis]
MLYQFLLIAILFVLGSYEILQLTILGDKISDFGSFTLKQLNSLILTKRAWRNIYKYQHQ